RELQDQHGAAWFELPLLVARDRSDTQRIGTVSGGTPDLIERPAPPDAAAAAETARQLPFWRDRARPIGTSDSPVFSRLNPDGCAIHAAHPRQGRAPLSRAGRRWRRTRSRNTS